jgi:hypothetical protein
MIRIRKPSTAWPTPREAATPAEPAAPATGTPPPTLLNSFVPEFAEARFGKGPIWQRPDLAEVCARYGPSNAYDLRPKTQDIFIFFANGTTFTHIRVLLILEQKENILES